MKTLKSLTLVIFILTNFEYSKAESKIFSGQDALNKMIEILNSKTNKRGTSVYKSEKIQECILKYSNNNQNSTYTITTASGESVDVELIQAELERSTYSAKYSEDDYWGSYGSVSYSTSDEQYTFHITVAINDSKTDIALIKGTRKNGLFGDRIKDVEYKTKRIECRFN